ncbi:MAG: hypothetical protein H0T76_26380 [Nannocystis sp.]|nr:hypothetical protein [Nannocystis sp.]
MIPPLIHERTAPMAGMAVIPDMPVVSLSQCLPGGYRLGEHVVTEARGQDGLCELAVVTHAARGSLHVARVVTHSHAARASALLEAARLVQQHPQRNLLNIREIGWTAEATPRAFVVHDRLVGRSLASLLDGRGGVEWPLVLAIGLQCAEAVAALHRIGLAHTDLRPDSAVLVHVAGDQFRVVLGGLDHAQAISPGASAAEEPRVRDDLHALGNLLVALAARSEASGSRVPEVLSCLLWRMIDRRPAIRPASAEELHDQLSAVHGHVDPDLSGARMMGEVFRRITSDDFEVSIEADAPALVRPIARAQVQVRPRARGELRRRVSLLLVGLVVFGAGASLRDLLRPEPIAAQTPGSIAHDDDDEQLARGAERRIPEQQPPLKVVMLPRCEDSLTRAPRTSGSRTAPPLLHSPGVYEPGSNEPAAEALPAEAPEGDVFNDDLAVADEPDLLPIPVRGASLAFVLASASS